MKYVRLINSKTQEDIIVLCLPPVAHSDMAEVWASRGYKPYSAGFVLFDQTQPGGIVTVGRSETLNLGPHALDARIIGMLYGGCLRLAADSLPEAGTGATPHTP